MLRSPSIRRILGLLIVLLCGGPAVLHGAGRRVALLIGNNAYRHTSVLQNCANDARAIGEVLGSVGFEVKILLDADRSSFNEGFSWLEARAKDAELGLVFFSGHGVQVAGLNYLVPVDANMSSASEVRRKGLNASEIAGNLQESGCKTSILILDACRNNPFEKGIRGAATGGLAPMQASEDSLIAFAADAGQVAADNPEEPNGLYTQELLKNLKRPGIPIEEVFKRTRSEVRRRSGKKQTPAEYSKLEGNIVLVPPVAAGTPADPAVPAPPVAVAAPPDTPAPPEVRPTRAAPQDCYALCVGIDKYPGIPGGGSGASALDASAFRAMLVKKMGVPVSNARVLINERATLREFQKQLKWLAAQARPDRALYLYFGGMGQAASDSGELAMRDYAVSAQSRQSVNVFRSQDLREWLGTVGGARVVIVLDVAGAEAMAGTFEGTGPSRRVVASLPQGVALLASCAWNGIAWSRQTGGFFTKALVECAADGLPLAELADRVRSMLQKEVGEGLGRGTQDMPVLVDRMGAPSFVPFWSSSRALRPVTK